MSIRTIKPEERAAADLLRKMVYLSAETEGYQERLADDLAQEEAYEGVWAAFDGRGKMCSVAGVLDYSVRFDGHTVPMGGVAGIATPAEERRKGYVRGLFEVILPAMREEGKVFSFLYPFSFEFYRKFGYELCYTPNRVTAPMDLFCEYRMPERAEQVFPGGDMAELLTVYEAFTLDKNLPLVRDIASMRARAEHDPYITKHYAYLNRDENGAPDAYMLCSAEDGDGGDILKIREMAWTTPEGMRAMLGLIGALAPEFETLKWDAPGGVCLPALIGDAFEVSAARPAYGMNRILHVPRALALLKAPAQPGRVTLAVTDDALPANTGVYAVEWENGAVTSVKPSGAAADLETDVQTLAQLVTGFLTPAEALLKRGVTVNGSAKALEALFPHKDLYIAEYF
ncbi:MAG: GNAT family N-acetyltransferase [Oscillospiraceae bacterium]|nr:GNAT family N-acetyltransferase [Oscillospiraceae bacterium]